MQEYKIVDRYISGIETIGFIIEDENGNTKTLKNSDIIKLILSNKISNAEVVLNDITNDYEVLLTDLSLDNKKENSEDYSLTNRIVSTDNKLIGYIVKDKNGNKYKIDCNKAWKLAQNNKIKGIKACILANKKALMPINRNDNILKQLRDVTDTNSR